jgi:hypothetical protein
MSLQDKQKLTAAQQLLLKQMLNYSYEVCRSAAFG